MEQDEQKILNILKKHGNIKLDELAKKSGFSKQKVWRIQKKLEQTKTIWGYSAIDDTVQQDLQHFILLVKRTSKPLPEQIRKEFITESIENYLPGEIIAQEIYFTHGIYDVTVTFQAKDIVSAKRFVERLSIALGEYYHSPHLMQTLFPVRVRGIKNPNIKKLVEFL